MRVHTYLGKYRRDLPLSQAIGHPQLRDADVEMLGHQENMFLMAIYIVSRSDVSMLQGREGSGEI
jgi:hypothetical protein